MRITAKLKLVTTQDQTASLYGTMVLANKCCNWLSEKAWETKQFSMLQAQTSVWVDDFRFAVSINLGGQTQV